MPNSYREDWDRAVAAMQREGVPEPLAQRLASSRVLGSALDIAYLAREARVPLAEAAGVYFHAGDRFRLLWLLPAIVNLQVSGKWQALARNNLRDDAYRIHRMLSARILQHPGDTPLARVDAWAAAGGRRVKFALGRLQELQTAGSADFPSLAVAVRELRKLRDL